MADETTILDTSSAFDYLDLNEIDPTTRPLPEAVYTLQILDAKQQSGVGKASGKPYTCIVMSLAVVNHPEYSGRRLWERFFPNDFHKKALRRLMDATGVEQTPGEPIISWLERLTMEKPEFNALVKTKDEDNNVINWYNVSPATTTS